MYQMKKVAAKIFGQMINVYFLYKLKHFLRVSSHHSGMVWVFQC